MGGINIERMRNIWPRMFSNESRSQSETHVRHANLFVTNKKPKTKIREEKENEQNIRCKNISEILTTNYYIPI